IRRITAGESRYGLFRVRRSRGASSMTTSNQETRRPTSAPTASAAGEAGPDGASRREGFHLEPRLAHMKQALRDGSHQRFRTSPEVDMLAECEREQLSWPQ